MDPDKDTHPEQDPDPDPYQNVTVPLLLFSAVK
jgi:hypothetical protein